MLLIITSDNRCKLRHSHPMHTCGVRDGQVGRAIPEEEENRATGPGQRVIGEPEAGAPKVAGAWGSHER